MVGSHQLLFWLAFGFLEARFLSRTPGRRLEKIILKGNWPERKGLKIWIFGYTTMEDQILIILQGGPWCTSSTHAHRPSIRWLNNSFYDITVWLLLRHLCKLNVWISWPSNCKNLSSYSLTIFGFLLYKADLLVPLYPTHSPQCPVCLFAFILI